ncbi:MAG: 16S rRNA pseudouridine516 synthase [Oleiphilaceae bacterium]|jgi:16S rRNA pseudouridine516 synthase
MRLDKYICECTQLTRSLATQAIRGKRVTVNDVIIKSGSTKISVDTDIVMLDSQTLAFQEGFRYYMMHKPPGMVCANTDSDHPIIFDIMYDEPAINKLHTVGRLDLDTTGFLLITDDGKWSHFITSPKHHKPKTYRVWLAEDLMESAEKQFSEGILLRSEKDLTQPATIERISNTEVLVTLNEGKYHQVKRMFAAVGNHVEGLHREKIGDVSLDEDLGEGEYRELSPEEISSLAKPS